MTKILVTGCTDPMRWYADFVGYEFPFLGDVGGEYKTRQPSGYINFIQYEDSILIEVDD